MNKLTKAIVSLLSIKPFYGYLLLKFKINKTKDIPTMGVFINDKINLIYNEDFVESLELFDLVNVLEHECEHILRNHIPRAKQIAGEDSQFHKKFNIAADAAINNGSLVKTVDKIEGVTVDRLNKEMKAKIEEKDKTKVFESLEQYQSAEYYYNKINEFIDENFDESDLGNTIDDHSVWERSEGTKEMQQEVIKKNVNDSVKECGGIGKLSGHLASLVNEMNKSQVNWKQQLRQFFVNSIKSKKIPTRKKRNRRYGIIQPGVKRKPDVKLAVCVDTSGSVSDKELSMFWAEIDAINSLDIPITVIEADCTVNNVYPYEKKNKPEFKGRGGTSYQPAIDKAMELGVDGIMYFGDFDTADTPKNPNIPFLWVGVRNSPPPSNFGKTIYLKQND